MPAITEFHDDAGSEEASSTDPSPSPSPVPGVKKLIREDSLEYATGKMNEAMKLVMTGDMTGKAEKDFNHWMGVIENHPETKAKQAAEEQQYIAAAAESLEKMRRLIPPNIMAGVDKKTLLQQGIPEQIAARIFKCRVLWLIRMTPDNIRSIPAPDLNSRYSYAGTDLVELRAIYSCLPPDWLDEKCPDKVKYQWALGIKNRMIELSRKEAAKTLTKVERRNSAYVNADELRVFDPKSKNVARRQSTVVKVDHQALMRGRQQETKKIQSIGRRQTFVKVRCVHIEFGVMDAAEPGGKAMPLVLDNRDLYSPHQAPPSPL